jgi:hypothetical protein
MTRAISLENKGLQFWIICTESTPVTGIRDSVTLGYGTAKTDLALQSRKEKNAKEGLMKNLA